MITPLSLAISLGTSLVIFLFLLAVFLILASRPINEVIYFPARIIHGFQTPSQIENWGPYRLLREVFSASEDEVVNVAGLDAAVYFRNMATCLRILLWASLYCVFVLIPLCMTDDYYVTASSGDWNNFSLLSMGNVTPGSGRMWAFAFGMYWVTLGTLWFLFATFVAVTEMRADYEAEAAPRPEHYAVLVQDMPAPPRGTPQARHVDGFFEALHPGTFRCSLLISDISKVDAAYRQLKAARRQLAHAKGLLEQSLAARDSPEAKRPTYRTAVCCGRLVDAVGHWQEEVYRWRHRLEVEQQKVGEDPAPCTAALVFFTNRRTAAEAAQAIHANRTDQWQVAPAPGPSEIVWGNVRLSLGERWAREVLVVAIVILTICFYTVPITFISSFTTLAELNALLPFLTAITSISWIETLLEAYLPQLALLAFTALLPAYLTMLSRVEGLRSDSDIERAAVSKKFYFSVLNEFIGYTLSASLLNSLAAILEEPGSVVSLLGTSLPENATFFISYIALKFLLGYGLELSRIIPFFRYHAEKRYLCKTEDDEWELWRPGPINYVRAVPNDLLVIVLALCYAVIAPIILPFAILYFLLGLCVMKHQALNVYVAGYESAGRMWPLMHRCIVAALLVAQITMIGYLGIKEFAGAPVILPLLVLTVAYWYYCEKRFTKIYEVTPLEVASRKVVRELESEDMLAAYLPECMQKVSLGTDSGRYGETSLREEGRIYSGEQGSRRPDVSKGAP